MVKNMSKVKEAYREIEIIKSQ